MLSWSERLLSGIKIAVGCGQVSPAAAWVPGGLRGPSYLCAGEDGTLQLLVGTWPLPIPIRHP